MKRERGLQINTGANVTFLLFAFLVWGIYEQCCFLGLMGVRNMWFLGVETRNKCLYVVSDQLGTLESLYEVTQKWVPGEMGVYYNYAIVGLFFTLQPVASVIRLCFGHWA